MIKKILDKEFKILYQENGKIYKKNLSQEQYELFILGVLQNNSKIEIIDVTSKTKIKFILKRDYSDKINTLFMELNMLLQSEIDLFNALKSLYLNTKNKLFKDILAMSINELSKNQKIDKVFRKYDYIFGKEALFFIKSAQKSGNFKDMIKYLSILFETKYKNKSQLKDKLRYPFILTIATILAFTIIILFVIPRYKMLFSNLDINNSIFIKILFSLDQNIIFYFVGFILSITILILFYKNIRNRFIDKIIIKLPIIGKIIYYRQLTNFFLLSYLLIKANYTTNKAISYASKSLTNSYLSSKIELALNNIYNGISLSNSFEKTVIFSNDIIRLINNAQTTQKIDEVFFKIYNIYNQKQINSIKNFTKNIEPIIISIFSLIILFLALCIFLPLWNINNFLK